MAVISNYATLQTAVADYLARNDLTSFVPNFIQNAENKIYRRLNIRAEETAFSVAVTNGVGTVPTRFKKIKFAYINQSPIQLLEWMGLEDLYRKYPVRSGGETPCRISRDAGTFVFGPYPADFTLVGTYYQKLEPLRTTDSSWYVVNAPEILLYASLMEAQPFIRKDPRFAIWQALLDDAIDALETEEKSYDSPKGRLRARVA